MHTEYSKNKNRPAMENNLPPYGFPISENIISLDDGRLLATVAVEGMPFESEDDDAIHNAFIGVNNLLTALGKNNPGKLAVWTHIVKRRVRLDEIYRFKSIFVQSFTDKYCKRFSKSKFYSTRYYLSFVLKVDSISEGCEAMDAVLGQVIAVLGKYNASVLSVVEFNHDVAICENSGFLAFLLNNEESLIPLSHTPVVEQIGNSDWFFGYDTLEIRNRESQKSQYATMYLLKDYPGTTKNGMWDFLLKLPYEFVLSQSFIFTSNVKSMKNIDQQVNKLVSAGDAAEHQIEELALAKAYLSSGEIALGDYQASMVVFGETPENAVDNGVKVSSEFLTAGKGARWVKSNLEAFYTFLSLLPASQYRPLAAAHSSTNLSCGLSLHNYSMGKKNGNPIGDGTAIMPVKTLSDGLHYFNSHYSNPVQNVTGQKIAGHMLLMGASGTGKTTLEGTLCLFLQRFDPMMFVIDFNRSTELFVRAVGGSYFAIEEGETTGLNPFQIDDEPTPRLMSFLYQLVERCGANSEGAISAQEELLIKAAVDAVMNLPCSDRRMSVLMQSIPKGTDLRLRLSKWCASENGKLAWVLDAPVNTFNPRSYTKVGFDTTAILKEGHPATEPLLATLFFYKELMQRDGQLMLTIVEEFWMPCNFPLTQEQIKGILKAGRLKNEFIWLVSQSPEDAVDCAIFAALVQQTPTKVLLPNPSASMDAYLKIGLTEKEFKALKALDKESRTFLIKQSNTSCFAKMDLAGFDDFLPIISGTTDTIMLCQAIRERLNTDNPDVWIPELQRILREQREQKRKGEKS